MTEGAVPAASAAKTGITEFFGGVAIANMIDGLIQVISTTPIVPPPWDNVVGAGLALVAITIRAIIKTRAAKAA